MTDPADRQSRIWRARFTVPAGPGQDSEGTLVPVKSGTDVELQVDVVHQVDAQGDDGYAVLLSTPSDDAGSVPDDGAVYAASTCFLAFTNVQSWGDRLRELGFDCVEAEIGPAPSTATQTLGPASLIVAIPFFSSAASKTGGTAELPPSTSLAYTTFLTMTGVDVDYGPPPPSDGATRIRLLYAQTGRSPEPARPKAEESARRLTVRLDDVRVTPVSSHVSLQVARARYPNLAPIAGQDLDAKETSSGFLFSGWPPRTPGSGPVGSPKPSDLPDPIRRSRSSIFGAPSFRFTNVESVGFRLDLDGFGEAADKMLDALVEPLNFHLHGRAAGISATPFRYRAASRTVVVELLRYGKMVDAESPRVKKEDFASQHELVVRVCVGRVDDATAQARESAVFVPAIFVDNPWSKVVGRELLGYDKQLADFCVEQVDGDGNDVLSMTGRLVASDPQPRDVTDIRELRLLSQVGHHTSGKPFLSVRCPALDRANVDVLRPSAGFTTVGPWRQSDFKRPEFRRAFARDVVGDGFLSFRSIQPVPVDARNLPGAWVTGTYELSDTAVTFPTGIATLTFARVDGVPESWGRLCDLLREKPFALPTGDWYRLSCSIDLHVDDLLGS